MGNFSNRNTLKPEVLTDLQKQTEFTEDELQQFYTDFQKECPKGNLTKRHLQRNYTSCKSFPNGDATQFTEHVLRTFDSNQDGAVDFGEFMSGLSTLTKGSVDEKLDWIFKLFNVNKDGFISRSEMVEILKAVDRMMGSEQLPYDKSSAESRTDMIFQKADMDSDGELSRSEFLEAAKFDPQITTALFQQGSHHLVR